MATVSERRKADGTLSYVVSYRFGGRGSEQGGLTFDDRRAADAFKAAVEAHGADKALRMYGVEPKPQKTRKARELTVTDWVRHHIDHLTGVEQYTIDKYEQYLRNDITPHLGHIPLTELCDDDLAGWVKHMETSGGRKNTGQSPKTIHNKYGFLSGALNAAIGKHIVANPAAGRRLPRGEADDDHDMRMLTKAEFDALKAAVTEHWRPLVQFLVTSGTRWGEAAALQPKHVDVAAGTVKIRQAWKYSTNGYTLGPPKTKRSRRTVDVPVRLLESLDLSNEWVFVNRDGGPVRYHGFLPRVWDPAVTRAGLNPRPTPHDLRHTYASWQLSGGTPITVVSRQMGHESIKVTADVYADVDRVSSRAAADFMDRMLD